MRSMIVYLGHPVLVWEGKMAALRFHFVCYYASATGQYCVPRPYSLRSAKLRVPRPFHEDRLKALLEYFFSIALDSRVLGYRGQSHLLVKNKGHVH